MKNKNVADVSKKYNVSRTTIYNIIKDIEKLEDSKDYFIMIKGVKHFTDKGIRYLDDYFYNSYTDTGTDEIDKENIATENNIDFNIVIETLQKQLDYKDKQLDIKDRQIEKLHDVIDSLNRSIEQTNYIKALEFTKKDDSVDEDTKDDVNNLVENKENKRNIFSKIKDMFR